MDTTQNKNKEKQIGVAYIRESTKEQDFGFSPDNQEQSIRGYALKNDIEIVKIYKDLESGSSVQKRTEFLDMIDKAHQKEFEVVLVYHTSRFARNVREARKYKDELRKDLNIDVISVTQPMGDWENPSSFLNEGINELFDEYYSKQLSFWVSGACREKRRVGKPLGNPPLGYSKKVTGYDREKNKKLYSNIWDTVEKEAKIVRKIFKLYSTGKFSFADIAYKLNNEQLKTKLNNPFTYDSVRSILKNKLYCGLLEAPKRLKLADIPTDKKIIKPIISKRLFNNVKDKIKERTRVSGRPSKPNRFYLLQNLIHCYKCREKLKGKEENDKAKLIPKMYSTTFNQNNSRINETYYYVCKFKKETKSCDQSVKCEIVDEQIINLMSEFNFSEEIINKVLKRLEFLFDRFKKENKTTDVIKTLENKKKRLKVLYVDAQEITKEDYLLDLQKINDEIRAYKKKNIMKNLTKKQEYRFIEKTKELLQNFPKCFKILDRVSQRNWLLTLIKRVWVEDKEIVAIEPQEKFKPFFVSYWKLLGQGPLVTPDFEVYNNEALSKLLILLQQSDFS